MRLEFERCYVETLADNGDVHINLPSTSVLLSAAEARRLVDFLSTKTAVAETQAHVERTECPKCRGIRLIECELCGGLGWMLAADHG